MIHIVLENVSPVLLRKTEFKNKIHHVRIGKKNFSVRDKIVLYTYMYNTQHRGYTIHYHKSHVGIYGLISQVHIGKLYKDKANCLSFDS